MKEVIYRNVIEKMGDKFYPEEEFKSLLNQYTNDPYFWIGYFCHQISEIHGNVRRYYVRKDELHKKIEELRKKPKEEGIDIGFFIKSLRGILPEDYPILSHYFLGALGK